MSDRQTEHRMAIVKLFEHRDGSTVKAMEVSPSPQSQEFVNVWREYASNFDYLTSHYRLLRGLFDERTFEELDQAWEQLTGPAPSWPDRFFSN